ncbi:MAG TPA: glycosyltransferase [Candidatus Saccharimonadales bacterium]|nr:glycosyltransferase [Candidatus Saccharimonadales bacterium]
MVKSLSDVAVLIAVHNSQKTLDRCFESLTAQTYKNFTVICVNDASTDATTGALEKWQKKLGSRLKVITNPQNIGLTKSLNLGLKAITARFTARIDGDDWWHPDKLALQLDFLKTHPDYQVIGCNYVNIGATGQQEIITNETDAAIRQNFLKRNQLAHSCVVFDTKFVKKLGGYDENVRYGQDYDLWLRCLPKTKFYNLQQTLCYRHVGSGISVEKQREQMLQGIKIQTKYIRTHSLPLSNYLYTLELWAIVLMPEPIKKLKRRLFR